MLKWFGSSMGRAGLGWAEHHVGCECETIPAAWAGLGWAGLKRGQKYLDAEPEISALAGFWCFTLLKADLHCVLALRVWSFALCGLDVSHFDCWIFLLCVASYVSASSPARRGRFCHFVFCRWLKAQMAGRPRHPFHPHWKVVEGPDGRREVREWWEVPCRDGDRCRRRRCRFQHSTTGWKEVRQFWAKSPARRYAAAQPIPTEPGTTEPGNTVAGSGTAEMVWEEIEARPVETADQPEEETEHQQAATMEHQPEERSATTTGANKTDDHLSGRMGRDKDRKKIQNRKLDAEAKAEAERAKIFHDADARGSAREETLVTANSKSPMPTLSASLGVGECMSTSVAARKHFKLRNRKIVRVEAAAGSSTAFEYLPSVSIVDASSMPASVWLKIIDLAPRGFPKALCLRCGSRQALAAIDSMPDIVAAVRVLKIWRIEPVVVLVCEFVPRMQERHPLHQCLRLRCACRTVHQATHVPMTKLLENALLFLRKEKSRQDEILAAAKIKFSMLASWERDAVNHCRNQFEAAQRVHDSGFLHQIWLPSRGGRNRLHKHGARLKYSRGVPTGMTLDYFDTRMKIIGKLGWFGDKLYL